MTIAIAIIDRIYDGIAAWRERRRKFKEAREYNRAHTFSLTGPFASTWMCPSCCRIHHKVCDSRFFGPQFGECCSFEAGARQDKKHATLQ